jgi:hypothetical protein
MSRDDIAARVKLWAQIRPHGVGTVGAALLRATQPQGKSHA